MKPHLRLPCSVLAATLAGGALELRLRAEVEALGASLESVARDGADALDAEAHAGIQSAEDAAFLHARASLRTVEERHRLGSPMYTLARDGARTRFVVMTNETAFVGDSYDLRGLMLPVFDEGRSVHTGLYLDAHGWWVSGYAPLTTKAGRVVALVEADRPGEDLAARHVVNLAWAVGAALVAWILGGLDLRAGPAGAVTRLVTGRLQYRIGAAGAAAVVLATVVTGVLQHDRARDDLVAGEKARLATVVALTAPVLEVADVQAVAASGDATSDAFLRLRHALRLAMEGSSVRSPMYILRKDGTGGRYVAMTNEVPYVGDSLPLRSGVAATLAGGGGGTEGPYTDAHGTWVSAWAPLRDPAGAVVAVVQADEAIDGLLAEQAKADAAWAITALAGVVAAFAFAALSGQSIARPIAAVAGASRAIGRGEGHDPLPENRVDEVGDLARALLDMERGLRERERLRDMFGRYMTRQVADQLLKSTSPVALKGETREVTVLLSDIRGYTSLTERLGAADVVALLNEYFALLVDAAVQTEGVIDKFMGDAMLCWFGAPVPLPDHAARAVTAAREIQARLERWNAERARNGLPPLLTGIGIATGQVIVGNIGSPQKLEYTAIGDAVNLASRLCGKADGTMILASGAVKRAAGGEGWEWVGHVPVKGVAEPVEVWRVK